MMYEEIKLQGSNVASFDWISQLYVLSSVDLVTVVRPLISCKRGQGLETYTLRSCPIS